MSAFLTVLAAVITAVVVVIGVIRLSAWITSKKIAADPQAWKDSAYGGGHGSYDLNDYGIGGDAGGGDGD
ncbi:hypothetical protein [Allopontixanthobacter sp.]|uniref:hypothetical protein n=1 Tax=Allopontixanthobacter sp. TaxID=2906452 RepID=UPI002AB8C34B|nr:hypothetical protein [Allopontixanthobacter sp.]MDZ4308896.1 hypothetical protein [Allopontixanthobacter sp.]